MLVSRGIRTPDRRQVMLFAADALPEGVDKSMLRGVEALPEAAARSALIGVDEELSADEIAEAAVLPQFGERA